MGEILFHVVLLGVLGYFYKESFLIETGRSSDPIGPAGFPQAIILLAIVLTVISLFQTLKKRRKEQSGKPTKYVELSKEFIGLLAVIAIFALLVDTIGFVVGSFLLMLVLLFLLGERKIGKMAGVSFVVSISFTLLFGKLLSVPLPRGVEFLKELSFFIY